MVLCLISGRQSVLSQLKFPIDYRQNSEKKSQIAQIRGVPESSTFSVPDVKVIFATLDTMKEKEDKPACKRFWWFLFQKPPPSPHLSSLVQ